VDFIDKITERPEAVAELSYDELLELLDEAKSLFNSEPQLIEVEADKVLIVGDTHGDLETSVKALKLDVAEVVVFLGDYVDRGPYQIENINLLLARKIRDRDKLILLRGNHESPAMNYYYGFYHTVARRYGLEVYGQYAEVFSYMPYAVLYGEALLLHGGLARGLETLDQIREFPKADLEPSHPLAFQVLWNDPDESVEEFAPSPRGEGIYLFGRKAVDEFFARNGLKLLVRAHEYFTPGVYTMFEGKVVTVFSCRFYPIQGPKAILLKRNLQWEVIDLS